ncbi:MAG: M23 family metallopeptidase, partial [Candidatus Shapirobacteria bacterium]
QINQEGEITPQRAAEIGVIRNILVSNQPVDQWLDEFNQKTEGLRMDQITDDHVAAANNVRNILGQNPDMVKFMESTRLKAAMSHSVQAWMGQRIAGVGQRLGIQSLQNFGLKLSNSAGFSLNFAKDAAGVLSKTGFGMEGIKGVLGLVGGQGAGGLVTGIAAKLGLGATGVGLLVVGAQIGGAIIGKLFSPVTNFIRDKLGIDLGGLTNIGGSIASGLGLKAALPGLVAKLGAALPAVGSAIAGFGASVLGAISTAGATILAGPLIPIVIVGVIVGIPLIMMLTTNNQAATMVPPGRGVGGPVFDTATLPGGWLAPPPISVDPALLKDSCPQGFPMGGTITQGPNAPTCSHVGYENTIDIAGNLAAVTATHQGIVTTAGWTDSGYGNYVDIAGKCIRKDANNNPIEEVTFVTRYAHLESIGVAQNEEVLAGQTIGISDNTGNSTGPHVHYEVRGITWKLDDFNKYDRCCIGSAISCPN